MKTNLLTHVVPTLPSKTGEAGEYALELAFQLRDQYKINSQFILCDPNYDGPTRVKDFVVRRLRVLTEAGLWALLASIKDNPAVLLHYECYGYHKRGIPSWLYQGINSWLSEGKHRSPKVHKQFSTVFHELWGAQAKPWQGKFYLQILQKRLVEKLHRLSQISVTDTLHRQSLLDAIESPKAIFIPMPISLPMVTPSICRPEWNAPLRIAVFGQPAFRSATIKAHANLLRTLEKENRLEGVMLMSKDCHKSVSDKKDVKLLQQVISTKKIEVLGNLNPEDVSIHLSSAHLSLLPYGGEMACSSGEFMAALAAGCVAVPCDGLNTAPLQENQHFIASDDSPFSVRRLERIAAAGELGRIAAAGRIWYQRCANWDLIAQKYQEALRPAVPVKSLQERRFDLPLRIQTAPAP